MWADKSVNTCFKENSEDFLEGVFTNLKTARKESRTSDVALLEEQVQLMLREWKAGLNEVSPANSLLDLILETMLMRSGTLSDAARYESAFPDETEAFNMPALERTNSLPKSPTVDD